MNILAVDTAGKTLGVALLQDDRLEVRVLSGRRHDPQRDPDAAGGSLPEAVRPDLCRHRPVRCERRPRQLYRPAHRAGRSQGAGFPRETLCAPVSTLEALAAAHTGEGTVLCALDARRAQVYSAAFDLATHTRLLDDDARAVADLAQFVENCKSPCFCW